MKLQAKTKKQLELLLYKLLNDALFLWLIVFLAMLVTESAVPGYFFNHAKLTLLIFVLFSLLGSIAFLGKRNDIHYDAHSENAESGKNKLLIFLTIFSLALILNSLRSLRWPEIVIVSAATITVFFAFYNFFILKQK